MRLYLCEKPSQGEGVAAFLGMTPVHKKNGFFQKDDVVVTWARGHLFKLQMPEFYKPELKKKWSFDHLPICPDEYKYSLDIKAKTQFKIIKELLQKTKVVFIATDPDPEGESIARHILRFASYRGDIYRILAGSTDKKSLEKAFSNPLPYTQTDWMFQISEARRKADWVIGMNFTMAMSLFVQKIEGRGGFKGAFNIGRVKTPAAMLVLERELQIQNFKPKKYYEIEVDAYNKEGSVVTLIWDCPEKFLTDGKLLNKELTEKVIEYLGSNKVGNVSSVIKEQKKKEPPLPYHLTSIQVACDKFDLTPGETLEVLQSIYEKPFSLTSYPRTDTSYLPTGLEEFIDETVSNLLKLSIFSKLNGKIDTTRRTKAWNDKKVEVHYGITPTALPVDMTRLTPKQQAVYITVAQRYLAQFMSDYIYDSTSVVMQFGNISFKAKFNIPVSQGWKEVDVSQDEDSVEDEVKEQTVPSIKKGEVWGVKDARIIEKTTRKPPRYTQVSLVIALSNIAKEIPNPDLRKLLDDKDGIGTPATRGPIIKDLVKTGLVMEKGKQLVPSESFMKYSKFIPQALREPTTSAMWERGFKSIEERSITVEQFIGFQHRFVSESVEKLKHLTTVGVKS